MDVMDKGLKTFHKRQRSRPMNILHSCLVCAHSHVSSLKVNASLGGNIFLDSQPRGCQYM